ncbi:TPA: spermidine synthase [Legionella pneumophila]|uniref:Spermine synthase n=1 Tax=Legionella quinlivanii TaxID=45073 RepID=A0A364LGV0_9GAMM|nr:spermine synthase [Legionella quinlivanii]RAP35237.1 spermine synthase [Legionella quinlivanii]
MFSVLARSDRNEKDFFGDPIIYRTRDSWGEILVIDRKMKRVLAFDPIYEQSCLNLNEPHIPAHEYTRIMLLVLAFVHPKHVTLLGLGGGCLLHSLHYLMPQCTISAIELRKKVHEVALNFFLMPTHPNIHVVISDAQKALVQCDAQNTQIIFADMYQAHGMNPFQIQKKFILQCARILDDNGWLVVNYHQLPEHNSRFIQCLQRYFSELFAALSYSGNYILFARKKQGSPLSKYQTNVLDLENQLNIKLLMLFKRITRVYSNPY